MPLGSSSDAPVMSPGPKTSRNVGHFGCLTALSDGAFIAKSSLEAQIRRFKTRSRSPRRTFDAKRASHNGQAQQDAAQVGVGWNSNNRAEQSAGACRDAHRE